MKKIYPFSAWGLWGHMLLFAVCVISMLSVVVMGLTKQKITLELFAIALGVLCAAGACALTVKTCYRMFFGRIPEIEILDDRLIHRRFWYFGISEHQIMFTEIGSVELGSVMGVPFNVMLKAKPGAVFECNSRRFLGKIRPGIYVISSNGYSSGLWRQGVGGVWSDEMKEIFEVLAKIPGVETKS